MFASGLRNIIHSPFIIVFETLTNFFASESIFSSTAHWFTLTLIVPLSYLTSVTLKLGRLSSAHPLLIGFWEKEGPVSKV